MRYISIAGAVGAAAFIGVWGAMKICGSGKVNHKIDKHEAKVVTKIDIEDLGDVTAFCRCWQSAKVMMMLTPAPSE